MPSLKDGVDLTAVARVSRNINLRQIRVVKVEASCSPTPYESLEPRVSVETEGVLVSERLLNVVCAYDFSVNSAGQQIASARIAYLLMYEVVGEAVVESDIEHFARANGVYHSWPFLRQFLFDLTAKMGFAPLTLPVFQVLPSSSKHEESTEQPVRQAKPRKKKTPTAK